MEKQHSAWHRPGQGRLGQVGTEGSGPQPGLHALSFLGCLSPVVGQGLETPAAVAGAE